MTTPFPGMDPYLERRGLWEEVHAGLIVGIQHFLTPLQPPDPPLPTAEAEWAKQLLG